MKKRNIIISTVLSAVLCVGNCFSVSAFADEYVTPNAEITGETQNTHKEEYIAEVGEKLADFIKKSGLSFEVRFTNDSAIYVRDNSDSISRDARSKIVDFCKEYSLEDYRVIFSESHEDSAKEYIAEVSEKLADFIEKSGLPFEVVNQNPLDVCVIDKGDDSVDMDARVIILDFCRGYYLEDYRVQFYEPKKFPDNGKITDLNVIQNMLSEYLKESCPEYRGSVKIDYRSWSVVLLDDTYWGGFDVAPVAEKFCNENNIEYSLISYHCIESGFIPDEYAVPEGVEASKYGDVTSSESVDVADIVKLNLFLLNSEEYPLTDVQKANADCCKDGVIDANDCTAIMNYVSMIVDESELSK